MLGAVLSQPMPNVMEKSPGKPPVMDPGKLWAEFGPPHCAGSSRVAFRQESMRKTSCRTCSCA